MRIMVERLMGDATVSIYNKQGDMIHVEGFTGKCGSAYIRSIPVAEVEYGYSKAVYSGAFEYKVVV